MTPVSSSGTRLTHHETVADWQCQTAVTPILGVVDSHLLFLPAGSQRRFEGLGVTFGIARPTGTDEGF